jgi:hypothetical protein
MFYFHKKYEQQQKTKQKQKKAKKQNANSTLSEQFQKPNTKIVERVVIDSSNIHLHDRSLSCLGTGTSIKRCGVRLVI